MATLKESFLQGVAEFNQQQYFDCHETFEHLWNQLTDNQERDYVQGILQIGVSFYHYQRNNQAGYQQLLEKGRVRLGRLTAIAWYASQAENQLPEVDLERLMSDLHLFSQQSDDQHDSTMVMPMLYLLAA